MTSFDPIKVTLSLAGLVYEWLLSRSWIKILVQVIPLIILVTLAITVWFVGYQDTNKLAERYLEMSAPGIAQWEEKLFTKLSANSNSNQPKDGMNPTGEASPQTDPASAQVAANATGENQSTANSDSVDRKNDAAGENQEDFQVPRFEEMLCRRVELLRSNEQSRFVVGTAQLLKGATSNAQKILRKIAPDDKEGVPKAHAIMALGYFNQFLQSRDQTLIPLLQHHADIAVGWPNTPKDVLMLAADLNWQRGKADRAVEVIEVAAERFPELYPVLLERANLLNKKELAETARTKAIIHFQSELDADPKNEVFRIQISQLLGTSDESLEKVEKLLDEGLALESTKGLVRAKSEVYRIRFMKQLIEKQGKVEDFSMLKQAYDIDKTNPLIAEQVARLIRDGILPPRELQEQLRDLLSSGEASILTHAIMSEYYLAANRRSEAIMHLEKVFQASPTEVKYANNLAYLYAKDGRLDDAQQTARKCLELLQRSNMQSQRFVDELLDTLGFIYEEQKKTSDAISSYELALRYNPERIDTREKLSAIYRAMGNVEVANAHDRAIETIKKTLQERAQKEKDAANQQSAEPPATEPPQPTAEAPASAEPPQPPADQPPADQPPTAER